MVCAIVLAAGVGERVSGGSGPKALLEIRGRTILDFIAESLLRDPVDTICVVHNRIWPGCFERWLKRSGLEGHISLLFNGVESGKDRRGALGDLAFAFEKLTSPCKNKEGFVVSCCDNLYSDPHLDELVGSSSAITCRNIRRLHKTVLESRPSGVSVDKDKKVKSVNGGGSSWRFCGPFFLSARDVPFLLDWVKRPGVNLDDIGLFFQDLAKLTTVRAVCIDSEADDYNDTGTLAGYVHAKETVPHHGKKAGLG